MLVATLIAERTTGEGRKNAYRYRVRFEGELIVEDSVQPECDACRALQARGLSGYLELRDALTGLPRYTVRIETCARLRVSEMDRGGIRFLRWEPFPKRLAR